LLLFVLVAGKQRNAQEQQLAEIREVVGQYEFDVKSQEDRIERITLEAQADEGESEQTESRNTITEEEVTELEQVLAKLLQSESKMQKEMEELLAEKEELATAEVPDPVPIPNVKRRQYLTGFQMEGEYILFLVRASGSMVGNTIGDAEQNR
jgi:hypothetical protein